VDFLEGCGDEPRVDLAVNTVAYFPFPALAGRRLFLSEPVWQGKDNGWDPAPGARMLGLLSGRALIDEPAAVRTAGPAHAFGSFLDAGVIPGGNAVRDGRAATFVEKDEPHARTLAGLSADGRVLILLVADGYHPGVSIGLNMTDASAALRAGGAYQGIFLDGGGSSALVGRGDDGRAVLFNRPAGMLNIPGTLRYIAVNLGFTNLRRSAEPLPAVADWQAPWYVVLYAKVVTWMRIHPVQTGLCVAAGILGTGLLVRRWRRRRRAATVSPATVSPNP
jgi:Phosphodiester glycosidase